MTDDIYNFDDIVEEMVTRGITRCEKRHDTPVDWKQPTWWVNHRSDDEAPQAPARKLFLLHPIPEMNPGLFVVDSCCCCNAVRSVNLSLLLAPEEEDKVTPDAEQFSSLSYWPGLDGAVRLHRTIANELFELEGVHV